MQIVLLEVLVIILDAGEELYKTGDSPQIVVVDLPLCWPHVSEVNHLEVHQIVQFLGVDVVLHRLGVVHEQEGAGKEMKTSLGLE